MVVELPVKIKVPFLACRTVKRLLQDARTEYSLLVDTQNKYIYVPIKQRGRGEIVDGDIRSSDEFDLSCDEFTEVVMTSPRNVGAGLSASKWSKFAIIDLIKIKTID